MVSKVTFLPMLVPTNTELIVPWRLSSPVFHLARISTPVFDCILNLRLQLYDDEGAYLGHRIDHASKLSLCTRPTVAGGSYFS
jgi:hypothetical protein